ncbi:MAG: hypothetical protein O2904_01980 [bacterium]|nr:hypothetical protein [bacterium]
MAPPIQSWSKAFFISAIVIIVMQQLRIAGLQEQVRKLEVSVAIGIQLLDTATDQIARPPFPPEIPELPDERG